MSVLTKNERNMTGNYEKLLRENLRSFYQRSEPVITPPDGARTDGEAILFRAFGQECCVTPEGIALSDRRVTGPVGVLISLYLLHANEEPLHIMPLKGFKDFPGSMPYHGAFHANTETILVPHVMTIRQQEERIREAFQGQDSPAGMGGDFSLLLFPLPKIALCYIFYLPDEDFPASATCLFSANAEAMLPLDGLADTAEYTSKQMITLSQRR